MFKAEMIKNNKIKMPMDLYNFFEQNAKLKKKNNFSQILNEIEYLYSFHKKYYEITDEQFTEIFIKLSQHIVTVKDVNLINETIQVLMNLNEPVLTPTNIKALQPYISDIKAEYDELIEDMYRGLEIENTEVTFFTLGKLKVIFDLFKEQKGKGFNTTFILFTDRNSKYKRFLRNNFR